MLSLSHAKAIVLLVLLGWVAYANSFTKVFLLDDNLWILFNEDLPNWFDNALNHGQRALIALSLTANYKLGGFHAVGYHLVNVVVHLCAGLTLYGIVRRTLLLPRWQGRHTDSATPLAFAIGLVWLVHPMHTHAVTYVIQRCESMMGLFYLLTLYFMLRGSQEPRPRWWYAGSILSAWLGMGCKEVMATGPLVMLIFDRVFLSESWGELLKKRWALHLGLWSCLCFPVAIHVQALLFPQGGDSAGFSIPGLTPKMYFFTQAWVILHYLRLAVWPSDLCFDYRDWVPTQTLGDFLPAGILLALLFLAGAYGVWKRHWLGFLAAWFFMILAITSSFIALLDIVNEYRMYLPLISIITPAILGGNWLLSKYVPAWSKSPILPAVVLSLVAGTLLVLTFQRNEDYRSSLAIWEDALAKRPLNYKVYNHIGASYEIDGKWPEATESHMTCIKHQPANFFSLASLGYLNYREGKRKDGVEYLRKAYSVYNTHPETSTLLATYFHLEGESEKALKVLDFALKLSPNKAMPKFHRAAVLMDVGRLDEAKAEYAAAVAKFPDWPEKAHKFVLARLRGRFGQSEGVSREALFFAKIANDASPEKNPEYLATLADAYALNGRYAAAIAAADQALTLIPEDRRDLKAQIEMKRLTWMSRSK